MAFFLNRGKSKGLTLEQHNALLSAAGLDPDTIHDLASAKMDAMLNNGNKLSATAEELRKKAEETEAQAGQAYASAAVLNEALQAAGYSSN